MIATNEFSHSIVFLNQPKEMTMSSLINTQVQPFKTQAFHNGKFVQVSNETLKGEWSVLIFMPAAFTFNCPTEIEDAADNYAEGRAFGVHIEEEGLALRGTFIINPEGIIKTAEVHSNEIARDVSETLRKLKAAQYTAANPGQVCPAKWKEGAKTLAPSIDLVGKI
jgi:peroxiredoxin (alkyl hydroperoxide reductase subunit C)